jgi:pimeloyl-ACP methyl ester carboxylesterase
MPADFVRYTPEIETIDPHIDELIAQIIEFWKKKSRESPTTEGTGRAVRGAHAKSIGVVKAEVKILRDAATAYAQSIYAKPGRHSALIRFSSANNHLGPDAQLGPVLGFAIKFFNIDGAKLVDDEPDSTTFDLVFAHTEASQGKGMEFLGRFMERQEGRDAPTSDAARDAQYDAIVEWGIPDHAALQRLTGIQRPTLVIQGDDDLMIPTELSHLMAGLIPDAQIRIYPDAAHGFLFQYPTEVAADVNAFLTADDR